MRLIASTIAGLIAIMVISGAIYAGPFNSPPSANAGVPSGPGAVSLVAADLEITGNDPHFLYALLFILVGILGVILFERIANWSSSKY